jgi:hypothetical protein
MQKWTLFQMINRDRMKILDNSLFRNVRTVLLAFSVPLLLQQKQKKLLVFASIGFIECGPVQESQTFPAVSQTVFPKPKGQERTSRSFNRDKANGGAAAAMENWLSFPKYDD